eukprot:g9874.t1
MSHDIHGGDTPGDDFDLWWGVGPTRNNEEQHRTSHLGDMSSGGGIGSSTTAPSAAATIGHSSSRRGSGSLNPTTTTLMGSLWSSGGAPNLDAYGHRHHIHGSQGDDGAHVGSPPPPSVSSRPVWLPSPGQHHQHPTRNTGGAAGPSGRVGQVVVDDVAMVAAAAPAPPSSSLLRPVPGMNSGTGDSSSSSDGNVDLKLEELAAAITASVLGKLDTGVWEALATGQQHHPQQQQHPESSSAAFTAAASEDGRKQTEAAVAAVVAPLRSRLAALEEQVSQLTASAARSSGNNGGDGDASRGGRGGGGGVGGGIGLGRGSGGGNAAATEPMLALNALAQRTGTLEGRHKQVQAKVALLDNAFGPKASDWAQTIKAFLQEREATAGGGARVAATAIRPAGGGVSGSGSGSKGGKKTLGIDAPVFSPQTARNSSKAYGKGNLHGGVGAGAGAAAGSSVVAAAGARRVESVTEVVRAAQGDDVAIAGAAEAATAGARDGGGDNGCAACAQTRERCDRLEKRVAESETALSLLQRRTAAAATAATVAATTAAADAVKAWEVEESSRRDAAAEKAVSSDLLGRQQKAAAAAAGGGGNWASKASLEKLAGELRQLSEKAKDGEDTLALVDHGLKGVREEMAPLSGSVSALKRLVETHLREKEQAAELLKVYLKEKDQAGDMLTGYVTTITREVATITRQYVNGLFAPGVLTAASSGDDVTERCIQPPASAEPLTALGAPATNLGGGGGGKSIVGVQEEGGVG